MAQLPHQRDRLQSAEAFFDSLRLSLVHGVARVPGRAAVNRGAAYDFALYAASPAISALFHEVPCIKLLVATYGHNRINEQITPVLVTRDLFPDRAQDSVAFGMVYSKISDHFNQSYLPQSLPVLGAEKAFEVIRSKLFVRGQALARLAAGGAILGGGWSQSASRECRRCRIRLKVTF